MNTKFVLSFSVLVLAVLVSACDAQYSRQINVDEGGSGSSGNDYYHSECVGSACTVVAGGGANECSSDSECQPSSCGEGSTGSIDITDNSGGQGDTLSYTVRVQDAPNDVQAASVDMTYNDQVLSYVGGSGQGSGCVEGWTAFDCNHGYPPFSGGRPIIRCAGFNVNDPADLMQNESCDLLTFNMEVIGCGENSLVEVYQLYDHIAAWDYTNGCFDNTC